MPCGLCHKPILYGWKEGAVHYFDDDRTLDVVWEYNRPKRHEEHPIMIPLEFIGKAISNLVASVQKDRKSYLIEFCEKHSDVTVTIYQIIAMIIFIYLKTISIQRDKNN